MAVNLDAEGTKGHLLVQRFRAEISGKLQEVVDAVDAIVRERLTEMSM